MTDRYSNATKTLGEASMDRIKKSKILMVGAGGIGCELLKDLVLVGFGEIHIVDLDTIDLSNLNRQFLFRKEHIKKSKAIEAKKSADKFNPVVNIVPYHANIKDPQFNVRWFRSFDLVFNALDNLDARRHVNRICLAADTPLIESGTAGFNGQVQVIVGGKTECYDCNPKPVTKTFPVCTIRSTPSQPIHCIVWAKNYLFSQLFDSDSDDDDADNTGGADDDAVEASLKDEEGNELSLEEKQNIVNESNELKELKQALLDDGFAKKMFNKIFKNDINRLLTMDSMWKTRKPPKSLDYDDIVARIPDSTTPKLVLAKDHTAWSVEENFVVLLDSLQRLVVRVKAGTPQNQNGDGKFSISFDKDDEDTLDFVVAAANLRSIIFSIEVKSKFEIKQIAGNIIPAIATTNAIIAGICVLQSFKVLQNKLDEARFVFLSRQPDRVFSTEKLQPPNPYCVVSGVARAVVRTDPATTTLGDLIESLLKLDLGYTEELSIVTDKLLYDPDFDDNITSTLTNLNITDGSFITVIDEEETATKVNLEIYIEGSSGLDSKYVLDSKPELGLKPKPKEALKEDPEQDAEDDVVLAVEEVSSKRRLPDTNGHTNGGVSKKAKTESTEDDGVIIIEDNDAVIDIDDN